MKAIAQGSSVLLCCLAMNGCTTVGNGEVKALTQGSAAVLIVPGTTTQAEVAHALGNGRSVKFRSGCEVWLYDYTTGIPAFVHFIPIVGLVTTRMGVQGTELRILFDEHGIVKKYALADFSAEQ
jgi:hypothetical protein